MIDRLEEVVDQETAALRNRTAIDLKDYNNRKSQGLLCLNRALRGLDGKSHQAALDRLAGLRSKLDINQAVLKTHMDAVREVASVLTDYADWNRLRNNDVVWQTEGYFGMRFRDVGLRAGRTGFGVYRGIGGSLEELDLLDKTGRRVGLTYGYLEGEYGLTPKTSLVGRAIIGLNDSGVSGGAQVHLRIGSDLGTNLTVGGEALGLDCPPEYGE